MNINKNTITRAVTTKALLWTSSAAARPFLSKQCTRPDKKEAEHHQFRAWEPTQWTAVREIQDYTMLQKLQNSNRGATFKRITSLHRSQSADTSLYCMQTWRSLCTILHLQSTLTNIILIQTSSRSIRTWQGDEHSLVMVNWRKCFSWRIWLIISISISHVSQLCTSKYQPQTHCSGCYIE